MRSLICRILKNDEVETVLRIVITGIILGLFVAVMKLITGM